MYVLTNAQTGEELAREESKAMINEWLISQPTHDITGIAYSLRFEA